MSRQMTISRQLCFVLFFLLTTRATCQEKPNPDLQFDYFSLNATQTFRQNVCNREAAFARGEVPLGMALQGMQLNAYLAENEFFSLTADSGSIPQGYPGIIVKILDEIATRGGFTWRDSYAVYNEAVIPEDKTYTDLLLYGVETYDIVVSWWFETTARKAMGISFPEAWMDGSMILVGETSKEDQSFEAFLWLRPFTTSVWLLTLFSILAAGVVYWILELIDPKSDRGRFRSPMKAVYLSFITFLGHFDDFQPNTVASRVLAVSLALWALITCSAYTANLASFLVIQNQPSIILNSVEDAVRSRVPICVVNTYPTDLMLSAAFPNAIIVRKPTELDSLMAVRSGECTVTLTARATWEFFETQEHVNGECSMEWVGRSFRNVGAGFATKSDSGTLCTSLVRDVFHLHLGEMKNDGTLQELWAKHLQEVATVDCTTNLGQEEEDGDQGQLKLENLAGIFVMHYFLSFLAIVIAFVGVRYKVWRSDKDVPGTRPLQSQRHITEEAVEAEEEPPMSMRRGLSAKFRSFRSSRKFPVDSESLDGDVDDQVKMLRFEINRMRQDHQNYLSTATQDVNRQLSELTEILSVLTEKKAKGGAVSQPNPVPVPTELPASAGASSDGLAVHNRGFAPEGEVYEPSSIARVQFEARPTSVIPQTKLAPTSEPSLPSELIREPGPIRATHSHVTSVFTQYKHDPTTEKGEKKPAAASISGKHIVSQSDPEPVAEKPRRTAMSFSIREPSLIPTSQPKSQTSSVMVQDKPEPTTEKPRRNPMSFSIHEPSPISKTLLESQPHSVMVQDKPEPIEEERSSKSRSVPYLSTENSLLAGEVKSSTTSLEDPLNVTQETP